MSRLRFVHAADLHLDSPFQGIRREAPEYVVQVLDRATFDAYESIIDLCLKERVDALLVAGDIYDGADRSLRAQLRFVDGLERLNAVGVRSFVCHGNHDPLDGWEARLALPPGCVRFGADVAAAPVFPDEPERAMVHGMSFPRREVRQNPSPSFRAAKLCDGLNIGLLHSNVGGNPDHDSYCPCSVSDLTDIDIDYWALGHIHARQVLRESRPAIVYPGNPQGRHPKEPGAHGAYLVEMDEVGTARLEFYPTDIVRWETCERSISGIESENQILDTIDELAHARLESANGRSVVFRLALSGRGPMHSFLRRPGTLEDIQEQLNERYANVRPWLWCERIHLETSASIDPKQVACREDFIGDLVRLGSEMRDSPASLAELRESLRELYLTSNASLYLRGLLPTDSELRELLIAAEQECLAALVNDEFEA